MAMNIRKITEEDYHYLIDWNKRKDQDFLQQWAGPFAYEYPINQMQIAARIDEGSNIFIVEEQGYVIGTFELDLNEGRKQAFLSRVLFDEQKQGNGLGTKSMLLMCEEVFKNSKMNKIILHVYCYNTVAIHCYENAGFRVTGFNQSENQKWNSFTMEKRR